MVGKFVLAQFLSILYQKWQGLALLSPPQLFTILHAKVAKNSFLWALGEIFEQILDHAVNFFFFLLFFQLQNGLSRRCKVAWLLAAGDFRVL